jgi:glycosyltransferase involved in cell wall biosynthesis
MSVLVSIIIPVYNGAPFIAETVKSALGQTCFDCEIIVVNDGSSDNTLSVLTQFGDSIKIINISNAGVSNARNVGIAAASGEYVAFLDADDLWQIDKIKKQLAVMKLNPSVGFCCCNFTVKDHRGGMITHFERLSNNANLLFDEAMSSQTLAVLIKENFVGTASNVMITRKVLEKTGLFDTNLRQAEDYDLWLRCAFNTDFIVMSEVLLHKTTHETNLTNNLAETLECHESVLNKLMSDPKIKSSAYLTSEVNYGLAEVRYRIGNIFFNKNEKIKCAHYFFKGLKSKMSIRNYYNLIISSRIMARFILDLAK